MKLLAVDSNSVLNRAFYGIKLLTAKDGTYTNGVYGFMNILLKIMEETHPDAVAFAFDVKGPTFRHKQYDGYKAQRKGMPDELACQMPILKELLANLGYRIIEAPGYEGDDILGTLARVCTEQGDECVIATGDRDSLQLVSPTVSVRLASTKMGQASSTLYNIDTIRETYGLFPKQLIEVKALMGDSSDNIPGVAGVGEKTALMLIQNFESLDGVYENIESPLIKPGMRQKLIEHKETAYLSRQLATICTDAPIDTNLASYIPGKVKNNDAYRLLTRLETFSLITRLGLTQPAGPEEVASPEAPAQPTLAAASLEALFAENPKQADLLCRFDGDDCTAFAFLSKGRYFTAVAGEDGFAENLKQVLTCGISLRVDDSKRLYHLGLNGGFPLTSIVFDVRLAGYLLSPNSTEYTVSRLSAEYEIPPCPLQGDFTATLDGFSDEIARFSALCDKLETQLERNGQQKLLGEIELPLAQVLASMEHLGFAVDKSGIQQFGKSLDQRIADIQERIYFLAGGQFNVNSPKQLGEILFDKLMLPTKKKTKTGYSTNADVLEWLKGKHPIIEEILEYRMLAKLKSTYVDGLIKVVGQDGRIHSSFQQTETRTGRISSTEPNMQNIPVRTELGSSLRKFFLAQPGWVLIDADYSQIELRVLAHIANDSHMIEAFLSGEDIHTTTAARVFNMPPAFVTPAMRRNAKAVNFGIVYGIGAFSLSQDIGVSVKEADQYIKSYLENYSGVKQYMEKTIADAKQNGYVSTMFGRRRYLPELKSTNHNLKAFGERVAMNMPIQGSAADIIKIAMVRVYHRFLNENMKARLILQVHDELLVEAPAQEKDAACAILKEEMEQAAKLAVPMEVDVGVGESWYDAKK